MAYNEALADRVRAIISLRENKVEEKKMFGGLCFMVNDKMCVGVEKERLMLRIDPAIYETLITQEGTSPMDFTGRIMKGYIFVSEQVLSGKPKLKYWIDLA